MDKVSVIIPSYQSTSYIIKTLKALEDQSILPNEVIIVDEDLDNKLSKIIKDFKFKININHIKYNGKSFPPNKRNTGVKNAKNEFLAFLDVKTIPNKNWIEEGIKIIKKNKNLVAFGSTNYNYKSKFQKILFLCTYGYKKYETLPGTIITKENFLKIGYFIENVRAGDDIEWRIRAKSKTKSFLLNKFGSLNYQSLPKNILEVQNKYITYSFYNAFVNVQQNIKNLYLIIFLMLSFIIIPKWNFIIGDWVKNPLYIPNITKKYIITILVIYLIFIVFSLFRRNFYLRFFNTFYSYFVLFLVFISIFYWNDKIANWAEESIWYVPHITKIFIISILIISIVYRGIIRPYLNSVKLRELLPFNWFFAGIIGLYIDIIKAPFYLLGGILYPILKKK